MKFCCSDCTKSSYCIRQSFATEFGLTPACRARIVASGGAAESDDDPMAQLLKGGWQDDV